MCSRQRADMKGSEIGLRPLHRMDVAIDDGEPLADCGFSNRNVHGTVSSVLEGFAPAGVSSRRRG